MKISVQTASVQEVPIQSVPAVHMSCRECFCMYHLVIVGIVGFILGGVVCVGIFLYCQRQQQETKDQDKYNTLQRLHQAADGFKNEYVTPTDVSPPNQSSIDLIPLANHNQYYSSGSLKHKDSYKSLTVREASLKRDSLLRTNSMRTNLSLHNMDY
ncbi:MAG: hypothetical protein GXO35_02420 [Gammaproteobacteria bacterium]|nr:hypothetical protein [Gammaproteobacteria bacterium]